MEHGTPCINIQWIISVVRGQWTLLICTGHFSLIKRQQSIDFCHVLNRLSIMYFVIDYTKFFQKLTFTIEIQEKLIQKSTIDSTSYLIINFTRKRNKIIISLKIKTRQLVSIIDFRQKYCLRMRPLPQFPFRLFSDANNKLNRVI